MRVFCIKCKSAEVYGEYDKHQDWTNCKCMRCGTFWRQLGNVEGRVKEMPSEHHIEVIREPKQPPLPKPERKEYERHYQKKVEGDYNK